MSAVLKKLEYFLLNHTVWLFLTTILLLSYILMVEASQYSWSFYCSYFFSLTVLFLPVLFFSICRKVICQNLGKSTLLVFWSLVFLAYPAYISWLAFSRYDPLFLWTPAANTPPPPIILVTALALFFTELAQLIAAYLRKSAPNPKWFSGNKLEHNILLLLVLLAFLLGLTHPFRPLLIGQSISASINWALPFQLIWFSIQYLILLLCYYCFYYLNHYFLIPALLKKKGILMYGFAFVAAILLVYPLMSVFIHFLPIMNEAAFEEASINWEVFPHDRGGIPFVIMALSTPLIVGLDWYKQSGRIATLEQEKTATELRLLKQQINPHFFFNTLHNLYALSLTKDEKTPEVVLQLSELMRYVIYKGQEETVSLEEEVKYIEDYIQLQQIRLHKKLDFRFEKSIDQPLLPVPPLLFITFVENAFKHGIEPAESKSFLHLQLSTNDNKLEFSCHNSYEKQESDTEGIGLANLRRRLALRFSDKHNLTIEDTGSSFLAILRLNWFATFVAAQLAQYYTEANWFGWQTNLAFV